MKFAIVGTGSRHIMYRKALTDVPSHGNELVALCDKNPHRLALSASQIPDQRGNGIALYDAAEFDTMIADQRPHRIIVTTPDYLHETYIVRAMRAGCDVIVEKPMTIDLAQLRSILDARRETGRTITVTFNYRYNPAHTQLKELLTSGTIGKITAVDFRWHLDRVHGADYFRRWHRHKEKSGGLLVHKSTHHFDLANWWVDSRPATVSALGRRAFYTPATAERLGLGAHADRCFGCTVFDKCPYHLDLAADPELRALYLETEHADGYHRDRCVFAPDISIEDTMQVQVGYANQAMMNYTLCAYSTWEGFEVIFYGTEGELTHRSVEVHGVFGGVRQQADKSEVSTTLRRHGEPARSLPVWSGEGDHGGGDPVMLGYLFDTSAAPDKYERMASHVDGAWSIIAGLAANRSMETGGTVDVQQMLDEAGIMI